MFGLSYKEWCKMEDEWRKEMEWKLLTKRMQTVEDLDVITEVSTEEIDLLKCEEAKKNDIQFNGLEADETMGFDVAAEADAGICGDMDGGIDGGADGGMDGGCSM